jgi:phage baseplate assembly protein W
MAITPLRRKTIHYSDFRRDFTKSIINDDLARNVNENAVKESIRNLVLTNRGERPFQPNLGCDVRKLLFENVTPDMLITIKELIEETIIAYEPRCNLISVDVYGALDSNALEVMIVFNVINSEEPVELRLILSRVR